MVQNRDYLSGKRHVRIHLHLVSSKLYLVKHRRISAGDTGRLFGFMIGIRCQVREIGESATMCLLSTDRFVAGLAYAIFPLHSDRQPAFY